MRYVFFLLATMVGIVPAAQAQSVTDNLPAVVIDGDASVERPAESPEAPPSDPYMVTDVHVDVTADSAAHARDKALMQAERLAYGELASRLGIGGTADGMSDDDVAALVQSFEVQNENLSAKRYIGVMTIRFNPAAVQKKKNVSMPVLAAPEAKAVMDDPGTVAHARIIARAATLPAWIKMKRQLEAMGPVAKVETLEVAVGSIRVDLTYRGSFEALKAALAAKGYDMRQNASGAFDLSDRSAAYP